MMNKISDSSQWQLTCDKDGAALLGKTMIIP